VTIALLIEPEDQTVDPGRQAVFTVRVVNQSDAVDRVALDILGTAGGWSRLDPPAFALMPGDDARATMVVSPPVGTPLGPVALGIRATAETSGRVDVGEANLNVGAGHSIEAELRPRAATGRQRAATVVVLRNLGNAVAEVRVVASDPDNAITFDAPAAVPIDPGATADPTDHLGQGFEVAVPSGERPCLFRPCLFRPCLFRPCLFRPIPPQS